MKRRILCLIVSLLLILPSGAAIADFGEGPPEWLGDYDYRLWINGAYHSFQVPPVEEADGTVLIPLREVLGMDGTPLYYDAAAHSVVVTARNGEGVRLNLATGAVGGRGAYRMKLVEGHTLVEARFFDLIGGLSLAQDDYTRTIIVSTDRAGYGQVIPYDLGMSELSEWGQKIVPYTMNGAMIIPDRENCPVVIITNGAHFIKTAAESRYDIGFGYLMKALAEQGYAVFSINMSMQFSFENGEPNERSRSRQIAADHVSRILKANEGGDEGFPLSLKGRLDMQNVTLIGHSRNGQGIIWLKPVVEELGTRVNGLLAFAPAVTIVIEEPYPDVPTAILVPSQDNDVRLMDGYRIYNELHDIERETDVHLAYVFGGNHAAFNEALLRQDNRLRNDQDPDKNVPIMAPAEQRSLYSKYTLAFMEAIKSGGSLSSLPLANSGDFYGKNAMFSFLGGNRKALPVDIGTSNGAVVENVIGSYMQVSNTAGYMNFPGSPLDMPLYQISWESDGAKAELRFDGVDASGYKALTMDLAQDSTSPLNRKQDQAMAVILTDKAGKSAKVNLQKGTSALSWQPGEVDTLLDWQGNIRGYLYSDYTPLSTLSLPLNGFAGVDLSDIRSITLEFSGPSGCIVLRSASLAR